MSEMEYNAPESFVLTDEEGVEHEFELWDIVEEGGNVYYGLIPHEAKIEEDTELVILKVGEENGEEYLATIDNDEEYDRIGKIFLDRAAEEDEEEEE
ncbi:MAG: DUF1292 domain-containing protein [Oscillospiraceae bacterium]